MLAFLPTSALTISGIGLRVGFRVKSGSSKLCVGGEGKQVGAIVVGELDCDCVSKVGFLPLSTVGASVFDDVGLNDKLELSFCAAVTTICAQKSQNQPDSIVRTASSTSNVILA